MPRSEMAAELSASFPRGFLDPPCLGGGSRGRLAFSQSGGVVVGSASRRNAGALVCAPGSPPAHWVLRKTAAAFGPGFSSRALVKVCTRAALHFSRQGLCKRVSSTVCPFQALRASARLALRCSGSSGVLRLLAAAECNGSPSFSFTRARRRNLAGPPSRRCRQTLRDAGGWCRRRAFADFHVRGLFR